MGDTTEGHEDEFFEYWKWLEDTTANEGKGTRRI